MKVVAIVTNIHGKYFIKDKNGKVRELHVGDKIHEGDVIYGDSNAATIKLESTTSNATMQLSGSDLFTAGEFGYEKDKNEENQKDDISNAELSQETKTTFHSSELSHENTTNEQNAVGFQEVFLSRDGEIINVEAALLDTGYKENNFDIDKDIGGSSTVFQPLPTLQTKISHVDDDFYDTTQPGGPTGTNTAVTSFTFEALMGLKSIQIGSTVLTEADILALNSTPVVITMHAGELTLDGYTKVNNQYIISYTYKTSDNYLHDKNSDVFADTLQITVLDNANQTASAVLTVDVIDDKPIAEDDTNWIQEGLNRDRVEGNVLLGDDNGSFSAKHYEDKKDSIGADDDGIANDVTAIKGGTIGTELTGSYGFITLQEDGSYVYRVDNTNPQVVVLNDGDILVDKFTYTVTDSDGDTSQAELSVDIRGNSKSLISIVPVEVNEDALSIGTDPSSPKEEATGIINLLVEKDFSALDIVAKNGGNTLNITDLSLINGTQTVATNQGIVTLLNYSETPDIDNPTLMIGSIEYKYILLTPYANAPTSDNFEDILEVTIKDINGNSKSDDLVANIIDDKPIAEDDTNSILEGNIVNQIVGDVFSGDTKGGVADNIGADVNTNPVVEVSSISAGIDGSIDTMLDGKYGELILKANGKYKYILDNTNPDVKILVDGEVVHDVFSYTIIDADGDKVSANLDINIQGQSKDPVVVITPGTVEEKALENIGTDPSSSAETVTGYIVGTADDGFKSLDLLAVGGDTLQVTTLSAIDGSQTIDTPYGTLKLLSYTETPSPINPAVLIGSIKYEYTLTTPVTNSIASDSFNDVISVSVTDGNGDTTTEPLKITIVDDKPIATNDVNMVTEDGDNVVTATGNVLSNDNDGADTNVTPITAQVKSGLYGDFVLNTDGTYIYTLDDDNPVVDALNTGDTLVDTLVYTITDADGDSKTANLDITIKGFTDPQLSVADVAVVEDGTAGDMKVVFTINMDTTSQRDVIFDYTTVDKTGVAGKEYIDVSGTATIAAGATTATVVVTLGADDYVADSGKTFDLKISNVNTAGAILDATGTATIIDDSLPDTPYVVGDGNPGEIEASHESVTLKLISVDSAGNPTASTVTEGEKAYYKVIVVDSSDNPVLDRNGDLASGTVNVLVSDETAKAHNPIGGLPGDYDGTSPLNVEVNKVFSIDTIDDWESDNGETFRVAIANDTSYSQASDYENVVHDTTPVTTTINDNTNATALSLSGATTVVEGDTASYTLTLDHASETSLDVTVAVSHVDTDDADFDFSAPETKTQTITIPAGQTMVNFALDTFNDTVFEGNEDYKVAITGASGSSFENLAIDFSPVTTTITDVADTPKISISDITIVEDGLATFTVNISNGVTSTKDINFTYSTSDGTATAGKDYTAVINATGTISAGATSTTVTIPLLDDYIADNGESFTIDITPVTPDVIVTTSSAMATIEDDSKPNTPFDSSDAIENNLDSVEIKLIAYDAQGNEVASNTVEEGSPAYYRAIMVEAGTSTPVVDASGNPPAGTVNIAYTDGSAIGASSQTATNGTQDYNNSVVTVNLNQIFSVDTFDDVANEDDETFEINIIDNSYTLAGAQQFENVITDTTKITTTITESDVPTIVFVDIKDDATVDEADGAMLTHTLEFRRLDGIPVILPTGKQVTVTLNYVNDTTEDADFQTKQTTVVITGDGSSSYTFSNIVADDFLNEGSESYTLEVNSVNDDSSYFEGLLPFTLGSVRGTINDEAIPDEALVSIVANQIITEGETSNDFTVSVDQPASDVTSDITVALTYSGVAKDGEDYNGVAQVVIPAGSNSTTFDIATIQDKLIEGSETFTVAIGTITDTNFEAIAADPAHPSVINTIWDDVDANPDVNDILEGGNQILGNVLINDEVGVNGQVVGFNYFDESGVEQSGTVGSEVNTQYGRITVNADGSYTYYSDARENHPSDGDTDSAILKDEISYLIKDDNNDISSSSLTINVGDTIGKVVDGPASSVNEDDLPNGTDAGTDPLKTFGNDLGIVSSEDGVESVSFVLSDVQASLAGLKSHGVSLDFTLSGTNNDILTAKAGTKEIFIVTLHENGNSSNYDFELKAPLDHLNSSGGKLDSLDLKIPFTYKEIGATEDNVSGNLTVNVVDDTPTAVVDAEATVVEGTVAPITGNVLTNDAQGADGALLLDFKYKDINGDLQDKYFDTVDTYTVDTPTGSLTVNKDGSWSFTAHTYVDHDDAVQGDTHVGDGSDNDSTQGSFDYRLQDYDTDNSNYVTQVIHVTDGADPSSSGAVNAIDEDDIANIGSDTPSTTNIVSGELSVTGGSDPIDVTFTTTGTNTLTSNGVAITYVLSNGGHTLTGSAGTTEIFVATITDPTDTSNPPYTFELKGPLDHPDALDQNTQDLSIEYLTTDIDGDSVTSNLVVTVTDDIPSIDTPDDGAVDESGLPSGATPDPFLTVATGSLAVGQEADSIDTVFDATTIAGLESQDIQATLGNELAYALSNAGHTLTASFGGVDYFNVNIKNPTTATASYEFTLINAIHQSVSGGTQTVTFPFTVSDFDKDSTNSSFDIVITDDVGSTDKQLTLDEDGSIDFGVTSDNIEPQADYITEHGQISFNDTTNLFTYTPDADYSGIDNGITLNYVVNGVNHSVNVDATINPISDKPIVSEDASSVNTDEDTIVTLGLNAPVVKDDFDQNTTDIAPNSTDGDNPERLGAITLEGIPNGATLYYGSNYVDMTGSSITIQLSDLDTRGDGNDHISGLSTNLTMSVADFEGLQVLPPLNSGDNFTVTMKVTSYEVDDAGVQLAGVAGAESSQSVPVDVQAVTDDGVAITVSDINGNEDEWMRIDDAISITKTLDVDGSEKYELLFDGGALPAGTLYYQGTPTDMSDRSIGTDASGGFSITIPDIDAFIAGNYPIYVMTPVNDSTDIHNLKVTVNVHDTDSDAGDSDGAIKSASDFVDATVVPIANDITVTTTGSVGDEDTHIPLNLIFINNDGPLSTPAGLETIVSVTLSGVPDGAIIYDANGLVILDNSAGTTPSVTVPVYGNDTSKLEAYTVLPPAHSSKDFTLQVSMDIKDKDDDGSVNTDTATVGPVDVLVTVKPVSEKESTDTAAPVGDDITTVTAHSYVTHAEEDTYFNLNTADGGYVLDAKNEDAQINEDGSTNPNGNEETFVVFTNVKYFDGATETTVSGDTFVKYNDGTKDIEMKFSGNGEVRVPLEFLDTLQIKPAQDFSGTMKVDTYVQNQDLGDDASDTAAPAESSSTSTLVINVNPVPEDGSTISVNNLHGLEDSGRLSDGTIDLTSVVNGIAISGSIKSKDLDGSESFTIKVDDIPEDAALYYKGHILYANSADIVADGIDVTDNGNGTFKVQFSKMDLTTPPLIIPPHNSNEDITLKVSGYIVDSATFEDGTAYDVPGPVSTPVDIKIVIDGVADRVINTELRTFNIDVASQQPNGDKFLIVEESGGIYNQIVEEDASGAGVLIDFRDIYRDPTSINSYDNLISNAIDVSPVADTSVATETVNFTVTGLESDFDLDGAILVNGTGVDRIFTFTLGDLQAGNVKINVPEHYSGEINLKVQYVTTENDGDSKTSPFEDIKVLVTPKAEDTDTIGINALDVNEDTLTQLTYNLTNPYPDTNGNQEEPAQMWIKVADVESKDFTLFTDTAYTSLADTVSSSSDISIVTIGGSDYYFLENGSFNNLYVQYNSDLGTSADTSFELKYTFKDYINVDGKLIENISPQETTTYSFNLTPVTDDIDAKATSVSDDDGDANTDIQDLAIDSNGDVNVKVLDNTVLKVTINIDGVDTAGEVNIHNPTDTTNGPDYDGSEKIVTLRLDGVPKGISIDGGYYAGDKDLDGDGTTEYSGIWYLDNPQDADGGDLIIDGSSTFDLRLNIAGTLPPSDSNYAEQEVGGTISVSFENQDGGANIQTDIVQIVIDDSLYDPTDVPLIPMDITQWDTAGNADVIIEDTKLQLSDIVNFTVVEKGSGNTNPDFDVAPADGDPDEITSDKFSITIENLQNCTVEGWTQDAHDGVFWTYEGQGGTAEIQAALDALIITPNQDYNQNHDINAGDDLDRFNEGPLQFTTTLTTYADNGYSETQSLNYSGNVQPVTDDITIDPIFDFVDEDGTTHSSTVANEDGTFNIDMNIVSVDSPYLTVDSTNVRVTNVSPDNIGVIVADSSNESLDGQISWDNGATWHTLDAGSYVDIPYTEINKVVFKLNPNIAGDVKLQYSADVLEKDDNTGSARTVTDMVEFHVNPVADGLTDASGVKIVGDEDTFMELTDGNGASFNTLTSSDPTEKPSSLVLSGVPNGYLVYIGDPGSEVLANNLGIDASGNNSWTIDATGTIPRIWLKAPEDIGGVTSTPTANWDLLDSIKLTTGVDDMGVQIFNTQNVFLQINAVADTVSLDVQDISGVEGEEIGFNFNALVKDTDGSERLVVTLAGLGAFAVFKLAGNELDASAVSYDSGADKYTIDTTALDYQTIKQLSVIQNDFSGTVTVGITTVEDSNNNSSTEVTDTFTLAISQQPNTTGDDIMLFDLKGTEGGSGEDTLVFGTDWNSVGIDFTTLDDTLTKNIETLDLTQHGDHSIILNTTDVEAMTDARNALVIESDAGDTINIQNDGDNVWAQKGGTSVYEDVNGATLTINGAGTIDDRALSSTAGDDVLGYNDTNGIDAGAGNDRLIIFDTKEVDFSKVTNVETIDYSVVGDHNVVDLKLDDVIAITDSNNHLKILGDAHDNVDFDAADNWVKNDTGNAYGGATQTEGGKNFDVYTSANDTSVEVKVQVEVHDSI